MSSCARVPRRRGNDPPHPGRGRARARAAQGVTDLAAVPGLTGGLPHRSRALTSYPVVRYIGRDDAARTVTGWQHWLDAVADWLREGRSPTVFIHTPDNVDALELARRFHDDVRAQVPEVEPLSEPIPSGPPTLL